jgi:hypothetical protein
MESVVRDPSQGVLPPVINETPFFPSNADFKQISSVWANCRYWQDIRSLGFNIPDRYLEARVQNSSLPVSLLLP